MLQYQCCSTSLCEFELLRPPFFLLLLCIFSLLLIRHNGREIPAHSYALQLWYIITQKNLAWEESVRVWILGCVVTQNLKSRCFWAKYQKWLSFEQVHLLKLLRTLCCSEKGRLHITSVVKL